MPGVKRLSPAPDDGPAPPGDQPGEEGGERDGAGAEEAELPGEPAAAGERLRPRQAVGPGLDLPRDEGGSPEDPDEAGCHEEEGDQEGETPVEGLELVD